MGEMLSLLGLLSSGKMGSSEMTPTRRAKPMGVLGSEIWVKVGDAPPNDPKELSFVALDTAQRLM
jgi:hypothetical protein